MCQESVVSTASHAVLLVCGVLLPSWGELWWLRGLRKLGQKPPFTEQLHIVCQSLCILPVVTNLYCLGCVGCLHCYWKLLLFLLLSINAEENGGKTRLSLSLTLRLLFSLHTCGQARSCRMPHILDFGAVCSDLSCSFVQSWGCMRDGR